MRIPRSCLTEYSYKRQYLEDAFCQHVVELTQQLWQHILCLSRNPLITGQQTWQHSL
jgi:hypothetical protein